VKRSLNGMTPPAGDDVLEYRASPDTENCMRLDPLPSFSLAIAATLAPALAQGPAPNFADPVRLKAGDKFLGEGRLYPSPVYHDLNGDGLQDIIVGDLPGHLTVALRQPGAGAPVFADEVKIKATDGKIIDFHNW